MPVFEKDDAVVQELSPGVGRSLLVDDARGSQSLTVVEVAMEPNTSVRTHYHPAEEAMVILEGELEATLGDEVFPVSAGHVVLAPPGVKHGFVNRSGSPAKLFGIHPTNKVEMVFTD